MVIVFTRAKSFDRWVSTKEELYNVSNLCKLRLCLSKNIFHRPAKIYWFLNFL